MNRRIFAGCNPRGQAQVKFATWLWLSKCQISAHAEIPDLSIAVRGQIWNHEKLGITSIPQDVSVHNVCCLRCTLQISALIFAKKMPTSSIPFGETVSYQVKELHVLRHVPFWRLRLKSISTQEFYSTSNFFRPVDRTSCLTKIDVRRDFSDLN